MQVPNHGFSAKQLNEREMTDLFEHAFLLMRHAAEKDILAFTLSGINKPMDLEFGPTGSVVNITDDLLHSHAKFLEQLYERIVSLARNDSMTATIRGFNDKTRRYPCPDCRKPYCPSCGKCECVKRAEDSKTCPGCHLNLHRSQMKRGACMECIKRGRVKL